MQTRHCKNLSSWFSMFSICRDCCCTDLCVYSGRLLNYARATSRALVAQECNPTSRPQRSRTCPALWPHYIPQSLHTVTAVPTVFPQWSRSLLHSLRSFSAFVPLSLRSVSAVFLIQYKHFDRKWSWQPKNFECALRASDWTLLSKFLSQPLPPNNRLEA